jgi:hypothetical protein
MGLKEKKERSEDREHCSKLPERFFRKVGVRPFGEGSVVYRVG